MGENTKGAGRSVRHSAVGIARSLLKGACALALTSVLATSSVHAATVLLNDSWTDGSRAETNLPTESATWVGVSTSDGGSLSVAPGALKNVMGTGSRKNWEYFTSDVTAPDANQPHNSVLQLNVGDTLTTSLTFTMPNAITSNAGSAGRDFRFGVFFDPTDPRVQVDTNSDAGGGTSPWTDATGYGVLIPLNSNPANTTNAFQMVKRTTSFANLLGSNSALTVASSGGTPFSVASNTSYTAKMSFYVVSASQLDVTTSIFQGNTLLSSQTVSDLGTSFGGTAVGAGLLPGSQSVYTKFDQLFFRMSSNVETSEIDFTNWNVTLTPEPSGLALLALASLSLARRRLH
jgi:hypothetical protein